MQRVHKSESVFSVVKTNIYFVKVGVNMNLSEILLSLKRGWKGKKGLWNTTRQLPDPTMAPQVFGQLFGVYLPILKQPQIFKISYFHKFY